MELLIARNPDPDSTLPYLLHVPIGADGLVFRTKDTWPRTSALYCHPVPIGEWPDQPEIVERIRGESCRPRRSNRPKLTRVTPWVSVACSVMGTSVALPRISSST
jgi:hypothetical protein